MSYVNQPIKSAIISTGVSADGWDWAAEVTRESADKWYVDLEIMSGLEIGVTAFSEHRECESPASVEDYLLSI